ncbi:MAG: Hint domain-containing protein [Pseudomonadota bacterium]
MAVFDRRLATRAGAPATHGFSAGTLLDTVCGARPVEWLRPGDALANGRGQAVLVSWRGIVGWGRGICIAEGALGDGHPTRTMVVASEQCVSVACEAAITLVGHPAPWMRAGDLLGTCDGVRLARSRTAMVAIHTSEVASLTQAGLEFRSWAPAQAKSMLQDQKRTPVVDPAPFLYDQGECDGRPVLDAREVAWLFKRAPSRP